MNKVLNKEGIYSALITPYDSDGEVSIKSLIDIINYEKDLGVEGFYCCGSSGEGLLLSDAERMKIVEAVAEYAESLPYIVHTGALSTRSSIKLSKHAQEHGAVAVSMIPPIYYKYTQQEIEKNYLNVADKIDIGMIVYNIPQFTNISFNQNSPLLKDDRIIGIKNTSNNLYELERMKKAYPDKILFNGFDEIYYSSLAAGATATIGTTINIIPNIYKKIRENFKTGNVKEAQYYQTKANDFIEALVNNSVFPATKYCLDLLGFMAGPCREPFSPLTTKQKEDVKIALDKVKEI
ncbi:MAG: dihydrodipicolinate synthase family protein [Spirochaetaceae bacterium]|nr:dihydrodipicolinate synthase family protein [Spirochaetaceae bacterium]